MLLDIARLHRTFTRLRQRRFAHAVFERPEDTTPKRTHDTSRDDTRPGASTDAAARRQSSLLRLSAAIASAQTEAEVCRAVVDGLHDEALGYAFLGVFLLDPATGDRVLRATLGWADVPAGMRVPAGQGLSARVTLAWGASWKRL